MHVYLSRFAVCVIIALMISSCSDGNGEVNGKTSRVDEILSRGTIRAGYVVYPPGTIKDPNTGELTGVFVDLLEESARAMSLEVEWVEEVGWGSMIEGLKAGRYDMIGSQVWANSSRAREADFTIPVFYSGICAYVRGDDERFNEELVGVNESSIRIATIDGEMSSIIARSDYGLAQTISIPQLSPNSQAMLNVVQNRADITFMEPFVANLFLDSNPGSLKNLTPNNPVRIFGNTMMLPRGDEEFESMINTALLEQINSGSVEKLFDKYGVTEGSFYMRDQPYR